MLLKTSTKERHGEYYDCLNFWFFGFFKKEWQAENTRAVCISLTLKQQCTSLWLDWIKVEIKKEKGFCKSHCPTMHTLVVWIVGLLCCHVGVLGFCAEMLDPDSCNAASLDSLDCKCVWLVSALRKSSRWFDLFFFAFCRNLLSILKMSVRLQLRRRPPRTRLTAWYWFCFQPTN